MSRTYNSKHKFNQNAGVVVFANDLKKYCNGYLVLDKKAGEEYNYDYTFTTFNDSCYPFFTTVRHPNKRKKRGSLGREFTIFGLAGTRYWRNRFGEMADKSSRMRLTKREITQKRRHKQKEELQNIINNIEDE